MKKSELISDDRSLLRDVVTQSLAMLHERNQNVYQRVRLVRRHLRYLVMVLATLLACIMALSMAIARGHPVFNPGKLLSIVVAGAVGGAVSSMYQVSRLGRAKIPEAHLQRLITMGRPLVGAAAGLFLYSVLQSNVINLPNKDELAMGLILGFIAGFSERFVLSTVSRVTAQTEKEN